MKRQWMGDAVAEPPPPDDARARRTAEEALEAATRRLGLHDVRFDLSGVLIDAARAETIGVHEGLHHHGDAPVAPGYTLAELSHLCRSTVPAQRSQALLTLAGVLRHAATPRAPNAAAAAPPSAVVPPAAARAGSLYLVTGVAVLRWCRDADTAVLLRLALDDAHTSCVHAALDAAEAMAEAATGVPIAAILSECARAVTSHRGYEAWWGEGPAQPKPSGPAAAAEGTAAESDSELCRRSVLDGWGRMGVCGRVRYLLDSGDLTPAGRVHALGLLCRLAHRSLSLAHEVARTPHMGGAIRELLEGDAAATALPGPVDSHTLRPPTSAHADAEARPAR